MRTKSDIVFKKCLNINLSFFFSGYRLVIACFVIVLIIILSNKSYSQDKESNDIEIFPALIQIEGYDGFTSDALFMPDGKVYVSMEDLFNFLKINCTQSENGNVLSGYIVNEGRTYSVNSIKKEIDVQNKVFSPGKGLMDYQGVTYLETSLFGEIFGINLKFDLRSLSINLKSDFELPIIKLMRLAKIRSNLNKARGEIIADTTLGRSYHIFRFGNLDWSLQSNQSKGSSIDSRIGLLFGSELLYGEAKISLNYYTNSPFDAQQLNYSWRWVDNNNSFVKQIFLGKIGNQSIASLYSQVIGFSLSNSPTGVRKAEGFYTITEHTEPNWDVELYINNSLMDYTKADVSGLFTFKVPIVYGFTTMELRFYGPMGEERSEQRTMNTPYSFTPIGKLEYRVNGGVLEDTGHDFFSKNEFSYGLSRGITLGGGLEFLSTLEAGKFIPFVSTSFVPFNKMMVKTEYAYGISTKAIVNWSIYESVLIELNYTKFKEGQTVVRNNNLSETKITLSVPYKLSKISGNSKIAFNKMDFKNFSYNNAEFLLSAYYLNYNLSLTTRANWQNGSTPYMNSELAMSGRFWKGAIVRSSVQFDNRIQQITSYRAELEQKFSKDFYLSLSYDTYLNSNSQTLNFSFRYNFPFARTFANARISDNDITTSEGVQGSVSYDSKTKYVYASDYSTVGRGCITVLPFLDVNHNGKYDTGEIIIKKLGIRMNGGEVTYSKRDSTIRIVRLEPFLDYLLEVNDEGFDNISWRIKNKTIKVTIDPNQFKTVEIPITPMGEISGNVLMKDKNSEAGIGRILIQISDSLGNIVAETLTEQDGYFNYLGLKPGSYVVKIAQKQLEKLSYEVTPLVYYIKIKASVDGEIVERLDFKLKSVGK